jgi:hypothetical protein
MAGNKEKIAMKRRKWDAKTKAMITGAERKTGR